MQFEQRDKCARSLRKHDQTIAHPSYVYMNDIVDRLLQLQQTLFTMSTWGHCGLGPATHSHKHSHGYNETSLKRDQHLRRSTACCGRILQNARLHWHTPAHCKVQHIWLMHDAPMQAIAAVARQRRYVRAHFSYCCRSSAVSTGCKPANARSKCS